VTDQLVITRVARTASGIPMSGPRDVIGAFTDEREARSVLHRLSGTGHQRTAEAANSVQRD
jgi:hypothetical protein